VSQRNDQRRRCGEAEPLGHRTVGREKGDGMKGRFALIVAAASGQSRHARWDIISSVGGAPRGPSTPAVWPLPRPLTTRWSRSPDLAMRPAPRPEAHPPGQGAGQLRVRQFPEPDPGLHRQHRWCQRTSEPTAPLV